MSHWTKPEKCLLWLLSRDYGCKDTKILPNYLQFKFKCSTMQHVSPQRFAEVQWRATYIYFTYLMLLIFMSAYCRQYARALASIGVSCLSLKSTTPSSVDIKDLNSLTKAGCCIWYRDMSVTTGPCFPTPKCSLSFCSNLFPVTFGSLVHPTGWMS